MTFKEWWDSDESRTNYADVDDAEQVWDAAVAAERERCAKIAQANSEKCDTCGEYSCRAGDNIAITIRGKSCPVP